MLVSAYACEPGAGSEPGIGWNFSTALAAHHEVWLLTRENNRSKIEDTLARQPIPGLHIIYFDLPVWLRRWKRGGRGVRAYYWLWQSRPPRVVSDLLSQGAIDLAHHITFGQYWSPSFLRSLDLPYVWGPVGGGESFPAVLRSVLGTRARFVLSVKSIMRWLTERTPAVRRTARRSRMALATTPETAKRLSALGAFDVQVVSAAALSQEDLDAIETAGAEDHPRAPRFVCIARLNGRKGELLCLRAFRQAQISGAQLEIFGDGPERGALERFVRLRGLGDSVVFHGAVPRSSILGRLAGATALVHLSPEESGGFVCLEAMAAGVPPIVLTAGGPAELVPTGSGVRIDVSDVDTVVCAAAEAMRRLATDSEFQRRLGATGRRQVRQHGTWRTKIGEIESMYERILSAERVPSRVADGAASTGED